MKYIKPFNESEASDLLTEEDISDYFLEFIDNEFIKFREVKLNKDYYGDKPGYIDCIYVINEKFTKIIDIIDIENYAKLIITISKICKRWNLEFELNNNEVFTNDITLTIKQPFPKILSKVKMRSKYLDDNTYWTTEFEGKKYDFRDIIEINNNMEFTVTFYNVLSRGSGKNDQWTKSDFIDFNKIEDKFIKHIEKDYILPCKYLNKIEDRFSKLYEYQFKLLI